MSSLKTIATAAVMAAVLYGVYIFLHRPRDAANPSEITKEWEQFQNGLGTNPGGSASTSTAGLVSPGGTEISPDQALAAMGSPSSFSTNPPAASTGTSLTGAPSPANSTTYGYGDPNANPPVGVPVAVSPPVGGQYNTPSGAGPLPAASPFPASESPSTSGMPMTPEATRSEFPPTDGTLPPGSGDSPSTTSSPWPTDTASTGTAWDEAMRQANKLLDERRLADAHRDLSRLYLDPNTTPENKKKLLPLLDQLAGTVIYSREHLLEQPCKVNSGDTLDGIAQRFNVPVGLLAKINGLDPTKPLQPGQELKVVQGPFNATIDLGDHELTLFTVDGRYAGRFPVGVGPHAANIVQPSVYMVKGQTDMTPFVEQGQTNLGRRWIALGENYEFGLHGTDNPATIGTSNGNNAISLGDRDIEDLYDILSVDSSLSTGSKVTVQP